jgi:hypothetical protein
MRANNHFCKDYHGVIRSYDLNETAESNPAVSMTPLNLLYQSHWDYGIFYKNIQVGLHNLIETAGTDLVVSWILGDWSRNLIETTKTDPRVSLRPWNWNLANDCLEYLGKYKTIWETWIRALGRNVWWKNPELKILWHSPFIPYPVCLGHKRQLLKIKISHWDCGIRSRGLIEIVGFDPTVSKTPQS